MLMSLCTCRYTEAVPIDLVYFALNRRLTPPPPPPLLLHGPQVLLICGHLLHGHHPSCCAA
jgi:hypothetical protein